MSSPHDTLFKSSFEDPKVAAAHFRDSLPPEVVAMLDLSKLRLEPGSFVDDALKERHTDLLFSAPWIGAESSIGKQQRPPPNSALLFLLFEHQSTVDWLMPLRMLRYEVRIWDRWLRSNPGARALPAIFPLVVYNGTSRWSAPVCLEDLLTVPIDLKVQLEPFLPRLRIVLQWLRDFEQVDLPGDPHGRLVLGFLRERGVDDMLPYFRENILAAKALPLEEQLQLLARLLHYSWLVSQTTDRAAYIDVAAQLGPEAKEIAMTYGERLIADSKAEGKAEGKAETLALVLLNAKASIIATLESRGMLVSEDVRSAMASCDDLPTVLAWLGRSGMVASAGELFEH